MSCFRKRRGTAYNKIRWISKRASVTRIPRWAREKGCAGNHKKKKEPRRRWRWYLKTGDAAIPGGGKTTARGRQNKILFGTDFAARGHIFESKRRPLKGRCSPL